MHVSNLEGPRHSLAWPIYSCGHGSEHWYSSGNDLVFLVVQLYICWRLKLLRPVKAQSLPLQSSKSLLENLSFTVKKNMCFTFVLKFPWSSFFTRRPLPPSATSCSFEVVTSFGTAVAVVIFCISITTVYCHHCYYMLLYAIVTILAIQTMIMNYHWRLTSCLSCVIVVRMFIIDINTIIIIIIIIIIMIIIVSVQRESLHMLKNSAHCIIILNMMSVQPKSIRSQHLAELSSTLRLIWGFPKLGITPKCHQTWVFWVFCSFPIKVQTDPPVKLPSSAIRFNSGGTGCSVTSRCVTKSWPVKVSCLLPGWLMRYARFARYGLPETST